MTTRIGLMLPGAVSLGAYEGGALAAVLKAVQASNDELVVDAIASASAGSMTALIACRALLCGADPIDLMTQTWVSLPQLDRLEAHDPSAPLTMKNLMDTATELLTGGGVDDGPTRQKVSVRLSMSLTALGGLTYAIPHVRDESDPELVDHGDSADTLLATTYVDFFTTELKPGAKAPDFLAVLDAAMTSGSTPVGFPPRRLNRTDVEADYKKNGVLIPPNQDLALWYSDGGDLDNQPFGRLLDLIGQIPDQGNDQRVIVMLNIEPGAAPTWKGTWFDAKPDPSWLSTLLHVDHVRGTQSLYDDLRRLEKTNRRIAWIKRISSTLEGSLDPTSKEAFSIALAEAAEWLADERQAVRKVIHDRAKADPPEASPSAETLEDLLLQAAGLANKHEVIVEVISPLDDPRIKLTADQQLSGEFMFHFGGFFDQKFRESDFALGYRNAQDWLTWWLNDHVKNPTAVLNAVKAGYETLSWRDEAEGNASLDALTLKEKAQAVGLLAHVGRVVAHDLELDIAHEVDNAEPVHHVLEEVEHGLHLRRKDSPSSDT